MSNPKTVAVLVKDAMKVALGGLTATSNGTEIQKVVGSGEDAFDEYPAIRVIPQGINRTITNENRYRDLQMNYVISCYLDMGDEVIPDEEIIDTLTEITDKVIETLDTTDWLPEIDGLVLTENSLTSLIDTTPSKTGTALYCDIFYPVTYRIAV